MGTGIEQLVPQSAHEARSRSSLVLSPSSTPIDASLQAAESDLEGGFIPADWYSDPRIFERERDRVFGKGWLFVGHASEVPGPGDFVLRKMAGASVILVRGQDEQIRVLLNVCRHRGGQPCRTEKGNASSFMCPYHGWTYDSAGALIAVPGIEGYEGTLDTSEFGLVEIRAEQHAGFVFGTFNQEAPSLNDYLGDTTWYLNVAARRSDAGLEVIGPPQRWVIPVNWKFAADNFVGDTMHFATVHVSTLELGLYPLIWLDYFAAVSLGHGHGTWYQGIAKTDDKSFLDLRGYPDHIQESLRRNLEAEQVDYLERSAAYGGTVYPNFSFFDPVFVDLTDSFGSGYCSYFSIRVWQPVSTDVTEVWSWVLAEKDLPDALKAAASDNYVRTFGAGGMLESDDMEVWRGATESAHGVLGRNMFGQLRQGMTNKPSEDFVGPGVAYVAGNPLLCGEGAIRDFYRAWFADLTSDPVAAEEDI